MAITRRQFLRRGGLATAGTLLGPGLFGHPFVRGALATPGLDRYFVVLHLDGGNDGLNTVTPIDDGGGTLRSDYEHARLAGNGGLRLASSSLLPLGVAGISGADPNTGAALGLHPGFGGVPGVGAGAGGLYSLYQQGKVAVVQACGYPDYSLSHAEAHSIWSSANPFSLGAYAGGGWLGRHLAARYGATEVPGACIERSVAAELRQSATGVLAIERLDDFDFPYDPSDDAADVAAKRAAFLAACQQHVVAPPYANIGTTGTATLESSESYHALGRTPLHDLYGELDRSLGYDFREIARIIQGVAAGTPNVAARYFHLRNGGYDTHSDQKGADPTGQHFSLHAEVGAALRLFFDALEQIDSGLSDKVAVLVWSEFSRRPMQNDNGTDHGSQGPMFLVGGKVNGGVYGNHPNIAESAWDGDGNTVYAQSGAFRSTDIRDVYGTALKHWLGLSAAQAAALLPTDSVAALAADEQWQSPNFDLVRPAGGLPLFKA